MLWLCDFGWSQNLTVHLTNSVKCWNCLSGFYFFFYAHLVPEPWHIGTGIKWRWLLAVLHLAKRHFDTWTSQGYLWVSKAADSLQKTYVQTGTRCPVLCPRLRPVITLFEFVHLVSLFCKERNVKYQYVVTHMQKHCFIFYSIVFVPFSALHMLWWAKYMT